MVRDDVASGAFGTFAPNIKQVDFACELGRGEISFFINFEATLLGTEVVLHEDIRFSRTRRRPWPTWSKRWSRM